MNFNLMHETFSDMKQTPKNLLRRWFSRAAVLLGLLASVNVYGQDDVTRDRAIREFVTGNSAYAGGDFATAVVHFERANEILPNPMLLEHIALCHARLGNTAEARRVLDGLLAQEPGFEERALVLFEEFESLAMDYALNEALYRVGSALQLTRGEQPRTRSEWQLAYGTRLVDSPVSIVSTPRGAEIFIDDLELGSFGTTPLVTPLFTGPHVIELRAPGYENAQRMVNVTNPRGGEGPQEFVFEMERLAVDVEILAANTGRVVWIGPDGENTNFRTFPTQASLPVGVSTFLYQALGVRERKEVDLGACAELGEGVCMISFTDQTHTEVPSLAELVIVAPERGAIFVDGQYHWQGPGTFSIELAPGVHGVEVRLDGHEDSRQEVEVLETGRTRVNVQPGPEARRRRR